MSSTCTYLAVDTKSLSSPPISSSCSNVRASPVDCNPITTHYNIIYKSHVYSGATLEKIDHNLRGKFEKRHAISLLKIPNDAYTLHCQILITCSVWLSQQMIMESSEKATLHIIIPIGSNTLSDKYYTSTALPSIYPWKSTNMGPYKHTSLLVSCWSYNLAEQYFVAILNRQ